MSSPEMTEEAAAWQRTAEEYMRASEYYKGLLVLIGRMLGPEAYVGEDGTLYDEILVGRVPDLVARRLLGVKG